MQETIMLRQTLKDWKNWESMDKLMEAMRQYGYVVEKGEMHKFEDIISPPKLTFKQCKKLICEGVKINWLQNKNCNIFQSYYDHNGRDKFERASMREVLNWYRINKNVSDEDADRIESMLPNELCNAVGLSDGYYSASYLMSLLDYVSVEYSYAEMTLRLFEAFNVYAIKVVSGRRPSSDTWLILHKLTQKCVNSSLYNNDSSNNICQFCGKIAISYKLYCKDRHLIAKSYYIDEKMTFASLKGISLYDWVSQDKEHRLPLRKIKIGLTLKIISNQRLVRWLRLPMNLTDK